MTPEPYGRYSRSLPRGPRAWPALLAFVLTLAVSTAPGLVALPPAGADAVLDVSPREGLNPDGAFVSVSGRGFVPNSQLFVMQCRAASAEEHICNSVGLRKVTTDANGSFHANAMRLVARFGATDCLRSGCAVMTSAVSDHSDNRAQDRRASISFSQPAPPVTQAPPPETWPAPPPAQESPAAPEPTGSEPAPAPPQATGATTAPVVTSSSVPGAARPPTSSTADAARRARASDGAGTAALAAGDTARDAPAGNDAGSDTGLYVVLGVVLAVAVGGVALALARRRGSSA